MTNIDVVIVSFRSKSALRHTVLPLVDEPDFSVIVVDNASDDGSPESVADLSLTLHQLEENVGFAAGCNCGWRLGSAPYVLFLNPDAYIDPDSVRRLASLLESETRVAIAAPLIRGPGGELEYSQRRFPRVRSAFAQAFFLHRVLPRAAWTDELVRDPAAYRDCRSVDWVSGACLLIRRELLERLGGWDEQFFMYCEDVDICRRVRDLGYDVVFEPSAVAFHEGGASALRATMLPALASSKALYARKHRAAAAAAAERLGLFLHALTHAAISSGGSPTRAGHLRAARLIVCHRLHTD